MYLYVNVPSNGRIRTNTSTVNSEAPKRILRPKPIGKRTINGTRMINVGTVDIKLINRLDFCAITKYPNIMSANSTGIIKNPAPGKKIANPRLIRIQIVIGATE